MDERECGGTVGRLVLPRRRPSRGAPSHGAVDVHAGTPYINRTQNPDDTSGCKLETVRVEMQWQRTTESEVKFEAYYCLFAGEVRRVMFERMFIT